MIAHRRPEPSRLQSGFPFVIAERDRSHPEARHAEARESHAEHPVAALLSRTVSAILMALIFLALYALFHAAAAAFVEVPRTYLSAGWFVLSVGVVFFALSARTIRAAWTRLCLLGSGACFAILTGDLLIPVFAGTDGVERAATDLPIELPWSFQAAWGGALLSGLIGIAALIVALGFLAAWYFLRGRHRTDRYTC